MKTKNYYKIGFLSLTAAFTLFIMSFLIIGVSAEESDVSETPAPLDIAYCNLSFENEVHIMYAVKSDDENLKLLLWEEAQTEYTLGSETAILSPLPNKAMIEGEEYTVFKYTGLSAKEMTDNVYVRAYISTNEEYGTPHKYSILQYAYNKLGKTDTATTDEKLINMLNEMLGYGASAQKYFNYKTDALATDRFVGIKLVGGILTDNFNYGLYKAGSKVTITAPENDADGAVFVKWVDESGDIIAETATAEITLGEINTVFTAVYETIKYSEGLAFTLNNDGQSYSVTGIGTCTDTDLLIPPTYEDLPVTSIGDYAFQYCEMLSSIVIPDSVIKINYGSFYGCKVLTSITIGNSIRSISEQAFDGCKMLENITVNSENTKYCSLDNCLVETESCTLVLGCKNSIIPTDGSVTSIGDYAFSSCTELTNITIPNSVINIGYSAFSGCEKLARIIISESVTNIGDYAFSSCTELVSIDIPSSVTRIGEDAFRCCYGLSSITFAEESNLESIGDAAFYSCTNLTHIDIPDSVKIIGNYAFNICQFANIVIPEGVTSIGAFAFAGCSELTYIEIPNSVTSIGDGAFECPNLQYTEYENAYYLGNESNPYLVVVKVKDKSITSCTLNKSTRFIYYFAFSECSELARIDIPNNVISIGNSAFYKCKSLTSIDIPSGVKNIADGVFTNFSGLTTLVIPKNVTSIGTAQFYGCTNLTSVTFENTNGWFISSSNTATSGTNIDVTDPNQNATYFTETYLYDYWKRSE